jgi:hypothetical protein
MSPISISNISSTKDATPSIDGDEDGNSNKPPANVRTIPPNEEKKPSPPRLHRQVVFRHPYPLPPPPILPRPDSAIISSHDVKPTSLKFKIVEPDSDLAALIAASHDDSLIRRSNAVGALKVLASKESNRLKMCRTRGLLEGLLQACKEDAVDSDALDARTRAVTTLLYLSEPKDNRLVCARHSGVLEVLVKVITEDTGEARLRACCCLATLAKTPQNRGLICNTEGLLRVLAELMMENAVKIEDKEEPKQPTVQRQRGSNDDSTNGRDDLSSYPSEDEQMLSNTYSGTFSHGSGTFTEELYSDEENSEDGEDASLEESDGYSTYSEESMEEEGVEMQISSLKKLNIENHGDFLARSQLSACATLIHLTKHCANAVSFSQLRC